MRLFARNHPNMKIFVVIILIAILLSLVLGMYLLFRETEDVVVINEFGASERETRKYTEERVEDYMKIYGSASNIIPDMNLEELFNDYGYEEISHFYNLIPDEQGDMVVIHDEGFRFLKNGKQEVFILFSREGIPLRRTRMSMMHVKLSRINQIPITIMGGVSVAKEERYQVFLQDYKGIYAYIRTVHITVEELTELLYDLTDEIIRLA